MLNQTLVPNRFHSHSAIYWPLTLSVWQCLCADFFLADSLTHIPYNMSDVYRFIYAIGICNLLDLIQHTAHSINVCKKRFYVHTKG